MDVKRVEARSVGTLELGSTIGCLESFASGMRCAKRLRTDALGGGQARKIQGFLYGVARPSAFRCKHDTSKASYGGPSR